MNTETPESTRLANALLVLAKAVTTLHQEIDREAHPGLSGQLWRMRGELVCSVLELEKVKLMAVTAN